ncbi:MAG: hypothetical protein ABI883_03640 [Chthoniobacterales bacterium]
MHAWKAVLIGLGLMAYTYFTDSAVILFTIGLVPTGSLFIVRS